MANYIASARSNKFRVRDISALESAMPDSIEVYVESLPDNLVCLLVNDPDGNGWPSAIYDEATEDWLDWDVEDAVAPHLLDGEWCVIKEVGAEKLRYLIGHARAFNNKGESHYIDLDDIFKLLPNGVSTCDY
ncbi:MAG: hypothetical protein ACO3JL_14485 [Myxococcota bacterium]